MIKDLIKLAGSILCICLTLTIAAQDKKPNVLFIAIDDFKPLVGTYGVKDVLTPNLDKLSESSTVFQNAYCQYPVCGPSRASIMTGLSPEVTGVLDLKTKMRDVNPNVLTIPQHFKNNGYTTVGFGKIYDPRCVQSRKEDDPESWSVPFRRPHGTADKYNKFGRIAVKIVDAPENEFTDAKICNAGIKSMEQLSKEDKPFFLAVGFKKPHLPFIAPKKYFDLYDPQKLPIADFKDCPSKANCEYILNDNNEMLSYHPSADPTTGDSSYAPFKIGGYMDERQERELLHGYYACASYIDAQVGKLLNKLDELGLSENTIVIVWGDHGFHLGDHGMWGKHTTMEESARVPLIIKAPGYEAGSSKSITEFLDVFPTLCDLATIPTPDNLEGISLKPILENPVAKVKEGAITQYKRNGAYGYSLRTEKYRYTVWVNKNKKTVYNDLYDIQIDPGETKNIVQENWDTCEKLNNQLFKKRAVLKRLDIDK